MIYSNVDILDAMKRGTIVITPPPDASQIGSASIDLTLDRTFWVFQGPYRRYGERFGKRIVAAQCRQDDVMEKVETDEITLAPGELILGITKEKIMLADNIMGFLEGRSRFARLGLAVHVTSSAVQPGSHNRQVLEIINFSQSPMTLHAGLRICQIFFMELKTPTTKPYRQHGTIAVDQ